MPKKRAYHYVFKTDLPIEVFSIEPVIDGKRGAEVVELLKWDDYGHKVKVGSLIVSVNGSRMKKGLTRTISRELSSELPINVRFEISEEKALEHEHILRKKQRSKMRAMRQSAATPVATPRVAEAKDEEDAAGDSEDEEDMSHSPSVSRSLSRRSSSTRDLPFIMHKQSSSSGGHSLDSDTMSPMIHAIPVTHQPSALSLELESEPDADERLREHEAARRSLQARLSYKPPRRSRRTASAMVSRPKETPAFILGHVCHVCAKSSSKKHFCKRCGKAICSKHGQTRRREIGYERSKSVRVCDSCVLDHEYEVELTRRPYGFLTTSGEGDAYAIVCEVKEGSEADLADLKIDSVIIEINGKNVEKKDYQTVVNKIYAASASARILTLRLKRLNEMTRNPKERIEREEVERKEAEKKEAEKKKIARKRKRAAATGPTRTYARYRRPRQSLDFPSKSEQRRFSGSRRSSRSTLTPTEIISPLDADAPDSDDEKYGGGGTEFMDEDVPEFVAIARIAGDYEMDEDWFEAVKHYQKAIKMAEKVIENELSISQKELRDDYNDKVRTYRTKVLRLSKKVTFGGRKPSLATRDDYTRGAGKDHSQAAKAKAEYEERKRSATGGGQDGGGADDGGGDDGSGDGGGKKKKKKGDRDDEFRERLMADIIDDKPDVSFADVLGLSDVKLALYETVILPTLKPDLFTGLRKPGMGILLFGPPGNGKTMIAKCIATQIDCTFFSISASSITSKFVGDAERIMRCLFTLARDKAPSVIFIDEIDSLLTARGGKSEAESSRRIKTEFLIQFDGVQSAAEAEKQLLLVGATNLPDQLDDAVLRRFSKRILVPHPDHDARYGLLRSLLRKQQHALTEEDFQQIAERCERYSCSDIKNLCKDAAMGPIRDMGTAILHHEAGDRVPAIEKKHFEQSLVNVRSSLPAHKLRYYSEWQSKYGSKFSLRDADLPPELRARPLDEESPVHSD